MFYQKLRSVYCSTFNIFHLIENPLSLKMDNKTTKVYFSSSPPQFCPLNRTVDIDAIVHVIKTAKKFINIAIMDYLPAVIYSWPNKYVVYIYLLISYHSL